MGPLFCLSKSKALAFAVSLALGLLGRGSYSPSMLCPSTEEQEESVYNLYVSEVRNIRLRLESCEDRLIRQIRTPLERDDLHESMLRITEQEVRVAHVSAKKPGPFPLSDHECLLLISGVFNCDFGSLPRPSCAFLTGRKTKIPWIEVHL